MTDFVVVPRRRSYCIDAIAGAGERQQVACFPSEWEALKRMSQLREKQYQRELRRLAVEASRFHIAVGQD